MYLGTLFIYLFIYLAAVLRSCQEGRSHSVEQWDDGEYQMFKEGKKNLRSVNYF